MYLLLARRFYRLHQKQYEMNVWSEKSENGMLIKRQIYFRYITPQELSMALPPEADG